MFHGMPSKHVRLPDFAFHLENRWHVLRKDKPRLLKVGKGGEWPCMHKYIDH